VWLVVLALILAAPAVAKKKTEDEAAAESESLLAGAISGLAFREIGPAIASGRVSDIAVDPGKKSIWYVTVASGGVWKTVNSGTTWAPIFDGESSYSVGCITIDPNDSNVLWVGTGENNSQRSVAYGDGVYKSTDGGKSWKNMGLPESEHIGRIVVDPRDSDVVFVAAHGPLWRAGGDRGLFKTVDGGETWENVLEISEHTGVNEVWMDPMDPDVLYASSYQRRRRTWTLIDGGPESAIYKSVDGGESWTKLTSGLPSEDMGKIGLAVSPVDPHVVYAIVESIDDAGGFYRSTDAGASWDRRSDYVSGSPQYYNEIIPDPHDVDRVYSMDTWMHVTENGGASFEQVPETSKHVDNHALWIDPDDADHLVAGCDGGVYETFDRGATWQFKANLPITQFYKITVDNDWPFYNVYGGTQDNSTLGGPSRTTSTHGITNRDWLVVVGGDGFQPRVDPENPDIVYSEWQNGGLVRYDRKNGELVDIQPQPEADEDPSRWNWDSPLIISPHANERLYYASQRIYRSDDRGDSWTPVSPDLTRQLDRNQLEVMGKVWSVDTVAKNRSTSYFGNIVSLSESPLVEGLVYAGTDDGLVQVSEDGGANWRRQETFTGVPGMAYVADLVASVHDPDTVFAAFDAHKDGDFKPYLLQSTDRGRTWSSLAGDLPEKGTVYSFVQDHERADLLFAGTEFGAFVTVDRGDHWVQLESGVPTIAVRDIEIQRRENDLVLGTFGRGFFILDDYSPLRSMSEEELGAEAILFEPRDALIFNESFELGYNDKAFQGDAFYTAPNPPVGAVFSYYLKEGLQTLRDERREAEKETEEGGGSVSYPSWEDLRGEDREQDPAMVLTVRDADGNVVRRLTGPAGKGTHRITWDLRYPSPEPVDLGPRRRNAFTSDPIGPMTVPGTYTVSLAQRARGEWTQLAGPVSFETVALGVSTLAPPDPAEALAFYRKTSRLNRAVSAAIEVAGEMEERLRHLRQAATDTAGGSEVWVDRIDELAENLADLRVELTGDRTISRRSEPTRASIASRAGRSTAGWTSSAAPTATHRRQYEIAAEAFSPVLEALRELVETDLAVLEAEMEAEGAPWTPGRIPTWQSE
jgi:photosystem II stability/assembly factor-like uncharacterized protein